MIFQKPSLIDRQRRKQVRMNRLANLNVLLFVVFVILIIPTAAMDTIDWRFRGFGLFFILLPTLAIASFFFWTLYKVLPDIAKDPALVSIDRLEPSVKIGQHTVAEWKNMAAELTAKAGVFGYVLYIVRALDWNAFATGLREGVQIVAWHLGLLRDFSMEEVRGVTAHEIGHLDNGDLPWLVGSNTVKYFSPIFGVIYTTIGVIAILIQTIANTQIPYQWSFGAVMLLIGVILIGPGTVVAILGGADISRRREKGADLYAACLGEGKGLSKAFRRMARQYQLYSLTTRFSQWTKSLVYMINGHQGKNMTLKQRFMTWYAEEIRAMACPLHRYHALEHYPLPDNPNQWGNKTLEELLPQELVSVPKNRAIIDDHPETEDRSSYIDDLENGDEGAIPDRIEFTGITLLNWVLVPLALLAAFWFTGNLTLETGIGTALMVTAINLLILSLGNTDEIFDLSAIIPELEDSRWDNVLRTLMLILSWGIVTLGLVFANSILATGDSSYPLVIILLKLLIVIGKITLVAWILQLPFAFFQKKSTTVEAIAETVTYAAIVSLRLSTLAIFLPLLGILN